MYRSCRGLFQNTWIRVSLCSTIDEKSHSKIHNSCDSHKCPSCFCPSCFCSYYCNVSLICCLDESYSTCIQSTISCMIVNQDKSYQMVSYCPNLYEIYLQPITKNTFLDQIPVCSFVTNMTYANINYSKCHGEIETIPWPC